MVEERIVKVNFRKRLKSIPRWKRQSVMGKLLRNKLKIDKLKISQDLNEKIWSGKNAKIKLKIVKDGKSVKAVVE